MQLLEHIHKLTLNPKNAARLKELVLELAVRGKLTEEWRRQNPDIEPASELLDKIKEEKEKLINEKKIKKEIPLPLITEEDIPYELPDTWSFSKIGDLFEIVRGSSPRPKGDPRYFAAVKTDYHWIKISDITAYSSSNTLLNTDEYLTQEGTGYSRKVGCQDIIIAASGSVGKASLLGIEGYIYDGLMAIRGIKNSNLRKFILFFFKVIELELLNSATGTSWKNINTDLLKNLILPIPPLAEQQVIIEKVEQLMQQIRELELQNTQRIEVNQKLGASSLHQLTNAADDEAFQQHYAFIREHVPLLFDNVENIKKLRESILQLAVQGKLTTTWRRQNLDVEPASVLLNRIMEEKERLIKKKKIKKEKPLPPIADEDIPHDLPESWEWCRFGSLIELISGQHLNPTEYNESGKGVPYLTGPSDFGKTNPVFSKWSEVPKVTANEKDILVTVKGSGVGKLNILHEDNVAIGRQLMAIRPLLTMIDHVFLFLDSNYYQLQSQKVGIAIPGIGREDLLFKLFPLPPLSEQQSIVEKVKQLMQLCDALEEQVSLAKEKEENIMRAIIHHALEGKEEVPAAV